MTTPILESTDRFSERHIGRIVFCLLALFPLVGMGVDLISPSLPAISMSLQVSHNFSKNLIAIYLLGYALGNFCLGFLSDAWGRRNLILIGFLGFTLASLLAPLFPHPEMLLGTRFLQGLCIAALAVIARGIISDIVPAHKIVRTGAIMATMWGLGPIIGPLFGGYLQAYFGWKACFYFFALFGFIGLVSLFLILPETLLAPRQLKLSQIKRDFIILISHRLFMGLVIMMGAAYATLIAFNTLGPFVVQSVLGYSPIDFGNIAVCLGAVFLIATITCRRILKQLTAEALMRIVVPTAFFIVLFVLIVAYYLPLNLYVLLFITAVVFFTCGLIYPAGIGRSMEIFRPLALAGSAAAVMNLIINVVFTGLTAAILSFVNVSTILPILCSYAVLIILCIFALFIFVNQPK